MYIIREWWICILWWLRVEGVKLVEMVEGVKLVELVEGVELVSRAHPGLA